jgi:hypothetical protein
LDDRGISIHGLTLNANGQPMEAAARHQAATTRVSEKISLGLSIRPPNYNMRTRVVFIRDQLCLITRPQTSAYPAPILESDSELLKNFVGGRLGPPLKCILAARLPINFHSERLVELTDLAQVKWWKGKGGCGKILYNSFDILI